MNHGSIESVHNRIITKLDILQESSSYIEKVCKTYAEESKNDNTTVATRTTRKPLKFTDYIANCGVTWKVDVLDKADKISLRFNDIQNKYYEGSADIISRHQERKVTDSKVLYDEYQQFLTTSGLIDQVDHCMSQIRDLAAELESRSDFKSKTNRAEWLEGTELPSVLGMGRGSVLKMTLHDTIEKIQEVYDDNRVVFQPRTRPVNNCDQCGAKMTIFPNTSEMRCDECGNTITLYGTIFEDSHFYNQQGQCTKHKKYDPNRHCDKWLNQIQARENKNIPQEVINKINEKAIKEYTRNGKLRSMHDMKCRQVREWLKALKLTAYNDHAALIRKIITGLNGDAVIPPQLSVEEHQEILVDFSRAMDVYERIIKREEILQMFNKMKISNKWYYPDALLRILMGKLRDKKRKKMDPRLPLLIECIHLQSPHTLTKNDIIWQEVCKELEGYEYEPIDRTMLIDLF